MNGSLGALVAVAVVLVGGSFLLRDRAPVASDVLAVAGIACALLVGIVPWVQS